ncbi:MAG TPA: Asp-tRNA(Asn)/Glu-tRNA(Gln) amidotransferase subunit GatC [Fredinandcohnia sp.]|nr:Asp-tRNA(Asn)/Glu-tRNA(Gln) amidotransferase subunit GatC [Fredinandcohnia sp.]
MALRREDVFWAAHLAAIAIDEKEAETYVEDLGALVDAYEKLQAVDVEGVEPTRQAAFGTAPMRPDEVRPSLSPEEALANAPAREGTSLLVPRIIE